MSSSRNRRALVDDDDDDRADLSSTVWGTGSGPSFIERARGAPDDSDDAMAVDVAGPDAFDPRFDNPMGEEPKTALQRLLRAWMNERHAPDILPAQDVLLSGLLDHIRRQVSDLARIR
jgi:hypothetical protein